MESFDKGNRLLMSVVIPTIGRSPHLRGLLERLQRQRFTVHAPTGEGPLFEVLVVANLPRQELRKMVASIDRSAEGQFEYLETGRMGVNLARNRGLDRAKGEIVLFLDDDAILDGLNCEPDSFLESYYLRHRENPEAIAIGGPYRLFGPTTKWDLAYHHIAAQWIRNHRRAKNQTDQLLGGNLSIKRNALLSLNEFFDDVIPYGGAETGLCQRLADRNEQLLFFDDMVVSHAPRVSRMAFKSKAFLQGAGAAWRLARLGRPKSHLPSSLRPRDPLDEVKSEITIYDRCFKFGFKSQPFSDDLIRNSAVKFSHLKYFIFIFTHDVIQVSKARTKSWIRQFYAAVSSIWISGRL